MALAVFGKDCGLGIVRVGSVDPASLFPEEAASMARAVPSRWQEFAAGRAAARTALKLPGAVPMGDDRAPVWPEGWAGSISHGGGWAIAVCKRGEWLVGVDLEPDEDLPADILPDILTPAETWRLGHDPRLARRVFAIKEAVYKAQFPLSREIFDFQTLDVVLADHRFSARFLRPVGPFRQGREIAGSWASGSGLVLAGVLG